MSDETTDESLGPKPEPQVQDPELYPGGTDAVPGQDRYQHDPEAPAARDLDPDDNPAVEDALPEEIAQPDAEKEQAPADDDADDQEAGTSEPPA